MTAGFLLVFVVLAATPVLAQGPAGGGGGSPQPVITNALADLAQTTLFVEGQNFGTSPQILFGASGNLIQLTPIAATSTSILAPLPITLPGAYLVIVRAGPAQEAKFEVTLEDGDISAVIAGAGLSGSTSSGDATLSVAAGGITSVMIADGSIFDTDVAANAAIAPAKISGTAATLAGANIFAATQTAPAFIGSGSGLTSLNASNISAGSLPVAHMPTGGSWSLASNLSLDGGILSVDQSNNRIGIGTTSPATPLQVEGNVHFTGGFTGGTPANQPNSAGFTFGRDTLASVDPVLTVSEDSNGNHVVVGVGQSGGVIGFGGPGSGLFFNVGGTEGSVNAGTNVMVLSSATNVGIGTQTPSEKLDVIGNIRITGTIIQASSRELKENILALSSDEALGALKALNPVTFKYRHDASKDRRVGFIAEEVPELVAAPDRKAVSVTDVVAVLTRVLQEQQKKISELEAEIQLLKQR